MNLKLSDIFIPSLDKQDYSKQALLKLEIKKAFIHDIEKRLDLSYLGSDNPASNLCFANHEQLRPEVKMFFSKADIIDYVNRILQKNEFDISKDKVPFPENAEHFWWSASSNTIVKNKKIDI